MHMSHQHLQDAHHEYDRALYVAVGHIHSMVLTALLLVTPRLNMHL